MLIGRKLGMTRLFGENGESVPVTVIKASPCFVIDRRTEDRDGYTAYVMGFGEKKEKRVKKPVLGLCKKAGVSGVEIVREFRTEDTSAFEIGEKIPVSILQTGDKISVVGWSKGRGFQGVVKRWGFSGGPGSHGSRFNRAPGSAGAGTYPGRVLKGKKFPGRMGNERVTVKNLEVVNIDEEKGLILVKGSVPGFRNGFLLIKISHDVDIPARKKMAEEKEKSAKENKEKKEAKTDETAEEKIEEKEEKKAEAKEEKREKSEKQPGEAKKKTEDKKEEDKTEEKEESAEAKEEDIKEKKGSDEGKKNKEENKEVKSKAEGKKTEDEKTEVENKEVKNESKIEEKGEG
jgi:large subunit ribosomal protein L3